ncbi:MULTISPECIES: IclR family transcriptional regulator [unclassified Hoeflea]|uniref:IclR family transcriptional regulator n=1 Tax=unclassified Hoeflea TaxID=2614931 RepID=UPI002AFE177A|nr:IclR family transcriptional regulator [Hoeflea sp.]
MTKPPHASGGTAAHSADAYRRLDGAPVTGWLANPEKPSRSIQSVERALLLIEIMAAASEPLPLQDLARRSELNTSTCHHLIATLVGRGYVLHAGRNRGYLLSSKLHELTELGSKEIDLIDFVRPDLAALSERLCEGVQMAVLRDSALLTQLRLGGDPSLKEPDEVKKMSASHATATGKAILAWLPEAEMARVISENGLVAYTDKTITSLSGFIEELRHVRRNGFSVDNEELQDGVICCGAALRDEKGAVIASISATYAARKNSEAYRNHVIQDVVQCARALSDRLRVSRF